MPVAKGPRYRTIATGMELLILSILILGVGPVAYRLVRDRREAMGFLDGLIFVSMVGLVFLGILPDDLQAGGMLSAAFLLLGAATPSIMERNFHGLGRTSHNLSLILGLTGLVLHAVIDGTGLEISHAAAHPNHDHGLHAHLGHAVILHRLPVGLTVWWLLRPAYGRLVPTFVLGFLAAATGVGFFYGPQVTAALGGQGAAWFQSFVAGSLLHVVFHRPGLGGRDRCGEEPTVTKSCCASEPAMTVPAVPSSAPCCSPVAAPQQAVPQKGADSFSSSATGSTPDVVAADDGTHDHHHDHAPATASTGLWEGLGGVAGLVLLGLLLAESQHARSFWHSFTSLALKSAPALLVAYTMAGLMNAFLPRSSIRWMGQGGSWSQSLRGMTVGLPFPICSCGVVPLFRTLVKRGTPPAAALGFLVATPELGVDAVLLSFPLLGKEMTIVRVVAAAVVALVIGATLGRSAAVPGNLEDGDLGIDDDADRAAKSPIERLRAGLHLSFGEGLDNTAPWILLGLVVAAFLGPLLEDRWLDQIHPALQVPLFALVGIPTYVCASGATPLVAVLLVGGVSPGAALAFLLTGPATNVTTFGVLAGVYGRAVAVRFSVAMITLPIALGYLTNAILPDLASRSAAELHEHGATPLQTVALTLLAIAVLQSFIRHGPRRFLAEVTRSDS